MLYAMMKMTGDASSAGLVFVGDVQFVIGADKFKVVNRLHDGDVGLAQGFEY